MSRERPLRVDLHTHILPPEWPDLEARFGYAGFVAREEADGSSAWLMRHGRRFRCIQPNCWDPRQRLADCERDGVDVQVLSTLPVMFSYWARPRDGLALARLLNDHIAAVVAEHPRRFVGLGTLPLQDTELACAELERCVGELGLAGVQIGTHVNGRNLDHPQLLAVLERAEALGAAVFVHPWDVAGGGRMARYWLKWLVGMPAETALAISSLIFSGALERLPRLRIAFAHGGGSFPATIGRIARGHAVRPDLCAGDNPHEPRRYVRRLYYDSLVHDADTLRSLVRLAGADRVALGSDYPFPLGEARPGALIDSIEEFDDTQRRRLLGGTALEFLGLSDERFA